MGISMGNVFSQIKYNLKAAYFWQRLLVLMLATFFFSMAIRLEPSVTAIVFFLATLLSALWLVLSLFKRRVSPMLGTKPMKPWWVRVIAMVTIVPILLVASGATGTSLALSIKPYTAEEIAENEAREKVQLQREEERRAAEQRQKDEKAKADPDEEAAEKAAAGGVIAFDDISQLKEAFEKAGGSCLEWNQSNNVSSALQSADCNSETVLMLFASPEGAKERAEELRAMYIGFDLEPNLLLGENWLINSKQVNPVHPAMGGTLITD
jgi:hypothetical protein